ncbi:MAG: type 4a pilus biogenesis protein PilO [Nitrospinae bacterium]|nr:type 4a pilus biogenesis protein PilO [Nitrospinota bacterium]
MGSIKDKLLAYLPYSRLQGIASNIRWGVVGGVPLVIVALAYFLVISPASDLVDAAKAQFEPIHKDVQEKEALERKLPDLTKQIAELEAQVADLRQQLPEKKEIPDLLDQVSAMGLQAGLEVQVFKPLPEVEKDFYAEVPVDITVNGTFHGIVDFFDKVARMPRIMAFTNVNMTKATARKTKTGPAVPTLTGTQISAICKGVTFRFLEAKVDKTAAAGKK